MARTKEAQKHHKTERDGKPASRSKSKARRHHYNGPALRGGR